MKKIIVIGGGPAGMMAAIRAAQLGASVVLLEKNEILGKKLLITGKGRCNVTNACELADFLKRFSHHGDFLRDAFKVFFNTALMDFFKEHGVPLKIERQQRVFPESDRSSSIVKALAAAMKKAGVEVRLNTTVEGLSLKPGGVYGPASDAVQGVEDKRIIGVQLARGKELSADAVILATGGVSIRTGSTGDGLKFAEQCGHKLIPLRPALVGLETREDFPKLLEGLALKNISLLFSNGRQKINTEIGELLFTAKGISGPLVVTHSGLVADWLGEGKNVFVEIDLKPGLSNEDLEARLQREFKESPRKAMKNLLKSFLPQRFIEVFLTAGDIDPDKLVNQISQKERARLLTLLKNFRLHISKTGSFAVAMVTQGGVSVKDIDPKTMQSRRVSGLYFAGEMIDVDADTGGFNLQAAFSTGYLAGQSSVLSCKS